LLIADWGGIGFGAFLGMQQEKGNEQIGNWQSEIP